MKKKFFIAMMSFFFANQASAVQLTVQDPCSNELWLSTEIQDALDKSVGALTIAELNRHKIPYEGSERGIRVIKQSPVGDDALEIISNEEMRAYGWCYRVDGNVSKLYSDEHIIKIANSKIEWFYGYALYLRGWINYCQPTLVTSKFICKKATLNP